MEDYDIDEKKQAAADVLFDYSLFTMTCIGEGIRPAHLRLHLLKEISGMPTSLKKDRYQRHSPSVMRAKADKASSSSTADDIDVGFTLKLQASIINTEKNFRQCELKA